MMLHEKIVPGQFLLDMKNDNMLRSGQQGSKLDIYNAYNYHHYQRERFSPETQVLDLSRRCDSVETRKTPSPYNSSFGTASPSTHCSSPPTSVAPSSADVLQSKLAFSHSSQPPLAQGIASLYPLYYPHIKQEIASPPPAVSSVSPNPLLILPQQSTTITKKTRIPTPASHSSPQPESSSLPSLPTDAGVLFPGIINAATTGSVSVGKSTRPFNAYPRDPLMVAAHFAASDVLFDNTTMERYSTYRKRALEDLRDTNGGYMIVTNPKMRRTNHRSNDQNSECDEKAAESSDNDSSFNGNGSSAECNSSRNDSNNNDNCGGVKDEAYFERRRKNNAAAKKSRDRRRIKEDEIAIRAAYLERQNIELLCQIDALKKQLETITKV